MVVERVVPETNKILVEIHTACLKGRPLIYLHTLLLIRILKGNTRRQVVCYSVIIFSQMITAAVTTSNDYN